MVDGLRQGHCSTKAVTSQEKAHFVLNGSPDRAVYLDMTDTAERQVRVLDTAWQSVEEKTLCGGAMHKLVVPEGGMIEILI